MKFNSLIPELSVTDIEKSKEFYLNLGFKKCALCGKIFNSNNYKRNYCYECSPKGLDSAKRLRF